MASVAGCSASTSATASATCASRCSPSRGARSCPCAGRVGADRVVRRRCPTEGVQRAGHMLPLERCADVAAEILGLADDVETGVCGEWLGRPRLIRPDHRSRSPMYVLLVAADAAVADGLGGRPVHIADQPHPLETSDQQRRVSSWPGSSPWRAERGNAVAVMPGFTHADDGEHADVATAVLRHERSPTEHVAHRVDAPRGVVQHAHPHETSPEQGTDCGPKRATEQPAETEREGERQRAPHREHPVEHDDVPVRQQVGGVTA